MAKTARTDVEESDAPEPQIRARNEERILRAAVDLSAARGFHGIHVKEIALANGRPRPSR